MYTHRSRRPQGPRVPEVNWQQGDIAFLKHYEHYSAHDYADLITSGHLHKDATVHPVILLAVHNGKAIITPVSAFRTEEQGFRPPWDQKWHQSKKQDHFRAFEGTRRPSNHHAALRLAEPSMHMPKPQASWIYAKSIFCVPMSVLGWFNKSPTLLRMHADSLRELTHDIRSNFPREYENAGARLHGSLSASGTAPTPQAPQAAITTTPYDCKSKPSKPLEANTPVPTPAPSTNSNTFTSWARIVRSTTSATPLGARPAAIRPQRLVQRTQGTRVAS